MRIGREGFKPLENYRYFVVTVQEGLRFPVFDKEGFCVFLRDEFDITLLLVTFSKSQRFILFPYL